MELCSLENVTGSLLRDWYETLSDEGEGCGSVWYATSKDGMTRFCVVMGIIQKKGARKKGDVGYAVAWKIGIQSVNNVMQSEFDVDFTVPMNHESGDVEDTTEVISCKRINRMMISAPGRYGSWDSFAAHVRKTARRVYKLWG